MRNDNKNIDPAEAARRKAEYEAKYITGTQSTTPELEPEPEAETGIFNSMNEVSEGDSKLFRNGIIIILILLAPFLFKTCCQYVTHH
jgi:hypothetical protein